MIRSPRVRARRLPWVNVLLTVVGVPAASLAVILALTAIGGR